MALACCWGHLEVVVEMIARSAVSEISMPQIRYRLGRLWYQQRGLVTLSRAASLVPAILATVPPVFGAPEHSTWGIRWSRWSYTDGAVMGIGPRSGPAIVVVKTACRTVSIQEINAQIETLDALHSDARLGAWRDLLPRTISEGHVEGWRYAVLEAIPGVDAQSRAAQLEARLGLLSMAATALRPLHEVTSEMIVVDEHWFVEAIDRPIALLRTAARSKLPIDRKEALARLAVQLRGILAGRTLRTCRIHGDFWLANVLIASDASRVTGIVDWSMAASQELPLHDVLHLILQSRQQEERRELGDVVLEVLNGGKWDPYECALLEAEDQGLEPSEGADGRAMVLLYWLRRLKFIIIQDCGEAQDPYWVERNIDGVLRCL